ncbi:hypothetical protein [Streptomyces sp. NPDC059142]|uniref:hypothetical protein n=1 Tax=Streptomyces sp. NPDC059142 TaxID=3346739 RepID=UPI0036C3C3DD
MTQTTTEVEAVPGAAPAPPVEKPPDPVKPPTASVEHTPGGWPVVPLAVTGTNSTVGVIAASALAGGPVAATLAATGAAVLGTAAVARAARHARKRTAARATSAPRSAAMSSARGTRSAATSGRTPASARTTDGRSAGAGAGRGMGLSKQSGSRSRSASSGMAQSPGAGKHRAGTGTTGGGRGGAGGRSPLGSRSTSPGRVGQVRALRKERAGQGPTRGAARAQATQERRAVADGRRAARADARAGRAQSKGAVGRSVARGLAAAGRMRRAAVDRARTARDQHTRDQVDGKRSMLRKAPSRRRARAALWRSAARLHGRRLLAAVLAAALGALGMLTTPLGRKLGWQWLQHPGRRLYRRLAGQAKQEKSDRDRGIRARLAEEEAAADAVADAEIGDRVERPAGLVPSTSRTPFGEVTHVSGFRFEEAAAEMENAARSYEPDGAMEILAMVENLPHALTAVANTFRILAERSDSEFPLEKAVAVGFEEIHVALLQSVSASDELGPLFRYAHEQDIARHEDPRNGPEAEKGWNV